MISLRPYQQIAIQNLRQAYADGHKKVILCAPTGAGKTVMFSAIAQGALQKGKRVMILTDRGELLWQAGGALNNLAIVPELITAETTRVNSSQRIFRYRLTSRVDLEKSGTVHAHCCSPCDVAAAFANVAGNVYAYVPEAPMVPFVV